MEGCTHVSGYSLLGACWEIATADRGDVGQAVFIQCTHLMDLAPWKEKITWRAAMPDR